MYTEQAQHVEPQARKLFRYISMAGSGATEKLIQEYDTQTFASFKAEGANVSKAQAGTGYSLLISLKRYGIEIDVTEEQRLYNNKEKVFANITSLATFWPERLELDLTHRFTFAGDSSYVNRDGQTVSLLCGDGVALASASHLTAFSPAGYSTIITGSPVFSEANLAVAELVGATNTVSNFGDKRRAMYNTLICADYASVYNLMRQVIQSNAQISAPNAEVLNVYKAKYDIVKLPYLATTATGAYNSAKKNYWGLVAAGVWNGYLLMWEEAHMISPAPGNNMVDSHADVWTYGTRIGYGIGVVSAQGVLMSLNAS